MPVLLCAFADQAFVVDNPQAAFSAMLNETGYSANGGTGSVAEYYTLSSNGQLSLIFDVYGPYTVSHNLSYYGSNTSSSHSSNVQQLVVELINLAAAGVDFSAYDANNDGRVDNISIFFAGYNEAEGGDENTLWPHQSTVQNSPTHNGKTFGSYLITSELRGNTGQLMAGIGTYCHEFGHVLGLPDLYNTNNNTSEDKIYTLGTWDIMCNGSYNNSGRTPPLFSAFERFMMGWHTPAQITEAGQYSLAPVSEGGGAYLLSQGTHNLRADSPSPSEYFLVENRQRSGWEGRHNDCLPGVGLLISHVTFSARKFNDNSFNNSVPLGVDIVEAYNAEPTTSTATDPYPGTMNITQMTPVLNTGDSLHALRLHNILQRESGAVSFWLGADDNTGFTFAPTRLDTFVTTYDGTIVETVPQSLTITGRGITSPTVTLAFNNTFFSLAIDSVWQPAGTVFTDSVAADGSYRRTVLLRFLPRRQACTPTSAIFQVFAGDSSAFNQLSVMGISPRPVYLTAPDSLVASEITTTTARIEWREVADAELYTLRAFIRDQSSGQLSDAFTREIVAPADHAYLSGLSSNTDYRVVLVASEAKSCVEHLAASDTLTVFTAIDTNYKVALPVVQPGDGTCVLYLPMNAEAGMAVYLFTTDGRLVAKADVAEGTRQITLPTEGLLPHQLYLVKYAPAASRLPRKTFYSKFVYRK